MVASAACAAGSAALNAAMPALGTLYLSSALGGISVGGTFTLMPALASEVGFLLAVHKLCLLVSPLYSDLRAHRWSLLALSLAPAISGEP